MTEDERQARRVRWAWRAYGGLVVALVCFCTYCGAYVVTH